MRSTAHPFKTPSQPGDFLPLTPSMLHILLALGDGPLHGYGIMKATEERTDGRTFLGPGNLYGSIKKMLGSRLVAVAEQGGGAAEPDSHRKRYRLTDLGRRVAILETDRLASLVRWARSSEQLRPSGGRQS